MTALDRYLVQADFEGALNSTFDVTIDAQRRAELTLVEVRSEASTGEEWESFSLLFDAGGTPLTEHDTYAVSHDELGDFALFLGPVQTATGEVLYESVFNHPKHDPRSRAT